MVNGTAACFKKCKQLFKYQHFLLLKRHLVVKVIIYFTFSTSVLIRHLWQLKTAVFLHWRLIRAALFQTCFDVATSPEAVFLVMCDPSMNEL